MSVEREIGFALGRAYPWLLKVRPLPDAGTLWARFLLEYAEAANDPG